MLLLLFLDDISSLQLFCNFDSNKFQLFFSSAVRLSFISSPDSELEIPYKAMRILSLSVEILLMIVLLFVPLTFHKTNNICRL